MFTCQAIAWVITCSHWKHWHSTGVCSLPSTTFFHSSIPLCYPNPQEQHPYICWWHWSSRTDGHQQDNAQKEGVTLTWMEMDWGMLCPLHTRRAVDLTCNTKKDPTPITSFIISIGQQQRAPLTHHCALALKLHNSVKERPSAGGKSSGARRQHITTAPRRHLRQQTTHGGRLCYEGLTRPGHHLFALLPSGRKHGLIKSGANRQINSVYPLKRAGSRPLLSCLNYPGLRHNNLTPSERKKTVSAKYSQDLYD